MGNSHDMAQPGTKVSLAFYQNRYCDLSIIGEIEILIAPLVIVYSIVALEKGVINWKNSEKEWDSLGQMQDRPVLTDLATHSLFHCLSFRIAFLSFLGTFSWGAVRNKDLLFCGTGHKEQLLAQLFLVHLSLLTYWCSICLRPGSLKQVLVAWSWRSRYWEYRLMWSFLSLISSAFILKSYLKLYNFFKLWYIFISKENLKF